MNMRDLSNDDDFISHLLVEKLGTGAVPLYVHKMDPGRRLPKTDSAVLLNIVRRLVLSKATLQNAVKVAVDELLRLPAIRYYLKSYTQKQINAFATHASRYFELYHPSGSIEIAHTSRYSHKTGKSELCILATRFLAPGAVITELKGSMANLTDEEDRELKRAGMRTGDIRRDFSVIHSKSMKKNHLFLGPARFVNHDCNNNCELFREGRYITFRVLRPINIGEEITAHYGDGYFGRKNRHCLCETCEKNGRGGYAPDQDDDNLEPSDSSSNSDSDSESETEGPESEPHVPLNVNERRTRRGVYAIVTREEESDESENEEDNKVPLADAEDIPADGEIELTTEIDTASELTSLTPSIPPDPSSSRDFLTPAPEPPARFSSSLSSLSSAGDASPRSDSCTPFRSIISTRRQKTQEVPTTQDTTPATPSKRLTRSASAILLIDKDKDKGKAPSKSATPSETPKRGRPSTSTAGNDVVHVKKEEVEPRVLRARPPVPAAPEPRKLPPKPDTPRDANGKLLPTCATCNNILPLISVDSKVVWGLGFENGKKKKKHDCPRCLRHFAIYNQPWPRRLPAHGTAFSVTPREETTPSDSNKRVTQKSLPDLDRKLAAAVSAGKRPRKEDSSKEDEPASKRRKTDVVPSVIVKVKPTATSKHTHTHTSASTSDRVSPKKESVSAPLHTTELVAVKRKRGRPRLSDKLIKTPPVVKVEEMPTEIPSKTTFTQPRNTNGRFGRKDTLIKAQQRAARVAASGSEGHSPSRKDRSEPAKPTRSSPRKKRENENPMHVDESPRKKQSMDIDHDKHHDEESLPIQKVLPRRQSTFKGASLVSNPNPLRFALQAWANPVLCDEDNSSSEDEQGPETPEDHLSPPAATIVDLEDSGPGSTLPRAPLTYKPSPFTFAKRRWASASLSPGLVSSKDVDVRERIDSEGFGQGSGSDRTVRRVQSMHAPFTSGRAEDDLNDNYPSNASSGEDEEAAAMAAIEMELVHVYPLASKLPHRHGIMHKSMQFYSQAYADSTKPTFVHAGWDDAYSDASD
ncbi:Histone-lysine N-methyltransferase SET9 [Leucoagaricus sp. SymC.cos]|nr:Histone-lysine N-methyltransferase SET9 [Leucoagaricus sp. SymC.cos]